MFEAQEHLNQPVIKFLGIYIAEVVDTADPSTAGRVKVRVFPMMTGLAESVLPWAVPAFALFEGGATDMGAYTVPAKNSRVYIFFAGGDVMAPVYFAAAPSKLDGPSNKDPETKQWKSRAGHLIEISDKADAEIIRITHTIGTLVEIDKDGKLSLVAGVTKIQLTKDGDAKIEAGGSTVTVGKDSDITILAKSGSLVNIGAGGTLKKLLNELAATLFNAHIHNITGVQTGPGAGICSAPTTQMGPTHQTAETKAS